MYMSNFKGSVSELRPKTATVAKWRQDLSIPVICFPCMIELYLAITNYDLTKTIGPHWLASSDVLCDDVR